MDIVGVEHVGIAVGDLDSAVAGLETVLGVKCSGREKVETNKVEIAVFDVGNTRIELITPAAEGSPISKFLAERGNGIHHICLKVRDIKGCLDDLAAKGIDLIDKTPRQGAGGHKIAFLSPKSVSNILLELSEEA
jgi:methylmalonyl-CoA/ethylmalonyl-CoA epimerase